jgi:hypothetical protein
MKPKTLKDRIISYLQRQGTFVNAGELERLSLEAGYKGSTCSRTCRELAEENILEAEERKNPNTGRNSVWYKISGQTFKKIIYTVPELGKRIEVYEKK